MKLKELIYLIKTDLYRYDGKKDFKTFLYYLLVQYGFQLSLLYRIAYYYLANGKKIRLFFFKTLLRILCIIHSTDLHLPTKIGKGIFISHSFGMAISGYAEIGDYCNISHQVTIGRASRGGKIGVPKIGNKVYIGPGVVMIGNIKIGNNVAIGANAVVTKDVPDNAVVAGVPAKILSYNGSTGYINNTDF
ncbi:MAG: serine acetyltransferase [Melioribacteraceae bacterium]|nr:serine acetyltransferase [Melioribacteraceae bacterium]